MITSDDQPETRQRVLSGGALSMLIKPTTIDALEDALRKADIL
jgi:response regulator of citrate/malate metabolism